MSSNQPLVDNIIEKQESATANLIPNVYDLVLEATECIKAGKKKESIEITTKAINECRAALELNPKYADAYFYMGLLYTSQEHYNDAIEAYKKALELDPGDEECKHGLATLEEKLKFIKQEPLSPELIAKATALKEMGNEYMKASKYKEAVEKYTEAIALKRDPVFLCNRAAALCMLKQYKEAGMDCFDAIFLDCKYAKAHGRIGFTYACLGDYFYAVTSYERALELDPNNESYKENLALAKAKLRETTQQP